MNINATASDDTSVKSSFIEQLVEHVFISEVLQEVWYSLSKTVEVLRSEVDASGYDIVFECNRILRHVQLKTSKEGAQVAGQKVNLALADKPSGCVVWTIRQEDGEAQRMKLRYLFYGDEPGKPLLPLEGFKVAKHTKANAQGIKANRPRFRIVPKSRFTRIATTKELVVRMFGVT